MFSLQLRDFTIEQFLQRYWQRKPVVIRQGFADWQDPITPDELAGLALEETVDSRLVYKKRGKWQAQTGPFESYDHLGKKGWSLIVQAVNQRHLEPDDRESVDPA